jgi:bleomycin hydrolase
VKADQGIMSISAFHVPENAHPLSRAERKEMGINAGLHAVQIVGYDWDPQSGKIVKWKIKNSWGEKSGDAGFYHMYADYFHEYATTISFLKGPEVPLSDFFLKATLKP